MRKFLLIEGDLKGKNELNEKTKKLTRRTYWS
jgi:hypothetical protein